MKVIKVFFRFIKAIRLVLSKYESVLNKRS